MWLHPRSNSEMCAHSVSLRPTGQLQLHSGVRPTHLPTVKRSRTTVCSEEISLPLFQCSWYPPLLWSAYTSETVETANAEPPALHGFGSERSILHITKCEIMYGVKLCDTSRTRCGRVLDDSQLPGRGGLGACSAPTRASLRPMYRLTLAGTPHGQGSAETETECQVSARKRWRLPELVGHAHWGRSFQALIAQLGERAPEVFRSL